MSKTYVFISAFSVSFIKRVSQFLRSDWFVLLVTGTFSWWLMQHTFSTSGSGATAELHIAGKAWSDFGAHLPLIRSFSMGQNWPPEYPLFANEPIRYHFLFYWLVGMLERAGVSLGLAFNGVSAAGLTLLLWMIYRVAKLFFRRAVVGWLAIALTVTNGSLSGLVALQKLLFEWWQPEHWLQTITAIVTAQQFASFGPWDGHLISAFWNLNIFTNQRHLGLSLGLVWWVIWPLLVWWQASPTSPAKQQRSRWFWVKLVTRSLVMVILPLLHQAGLMIMGWLVVALSGIGLLRPSLRRRANYWLLGSYALGLVLAGWITTQFVPASHQLPQLRFGFLALDKSPLGILTYWAFNMGLYLVLWLGVFLWRGRARWLVWLTTPLFLAANIWQFSPDMINNHKLINFFLQVLAIATAGWWVTAWQAQRPWLVKVICRGVLIGALAAVTFSGLVDFFPVLNDYSYTLQDWSARPVDQWLKTHTPPNSVMLTTTYLYHPASLVGRKLFLDYGYFAWSLGYNDQARRALLPSLFGQFDSTQAWCRALQGQNITAVIVSPGDDQLGEGVSVATSFMATHLQPTIKTSDEYQIYLVSDHCL